MSPQSRLGCELRDRLLEKPGRCGHRRRVTKATGISISTTRIRPDLAVSNCAKPQGRRRCISDVAKKLDKDIVEAAVRAAFETLPEADLIEIAIEKAAAKGTPVTARN